MTSHLRVAGVIEQLWHRVPGGTATAALGSLHAVARRLDASVIGVAARHRGSPPNDLRPLIPVRHLRLPRPALYESWHRLRRPAIEHAVGAVDVIHATGMAVPPRSAPLVVTVNDLAFLHEPTHFTARGLRFFQQFLAITREEADVVVVPSEATARDCERVGIDRTRIATVPLGVAPLHVAPAEVAALRSQLGLEGRYLLWVGTIEPRKNLTAVIAAWRSLRNAGSDVQLALVGPGGWHERLGDLLGPDRDGVVATGHVPAAQLAALYRGAAAFCYPSLREGFGLPVLEAMAQGTPVITSAGTSTEEVVGIDGDAGLLVDPLDQDDVTGAVERVLEDASLAEHLATNGRLRARTFSWDATADGLVAAYRRAATDPRSR